MNKVIILFVIVIKICLLNAYTFSPPIVSMSSSGINSSFIYTIKNEDDKVIPIDISINKFSKDIDGNHIQGEIVYDDFIIYPAQFILDVGEKRSVQVRWTGDPSADIEQNYTILCKEVELPQKQPKSSGFQAVVKVKKNYEGRLYIEPDEGSPDIIIHSIGAPVNEKGEHELEIVVENIGNMHGDLVAYCFEIHQLNDDETGKEFETLILTYKDISKMASSILAKSKRSYKLLWPEELPFGKINVELRKK